MVGSLRAVLVQSLLTRPGTDNNTVLLDKLGHGVARIYLHAFLLCNSCKILHNLRKRSDRISFRTHHRRHPRHLQRPLPAKKRPEALLHHFRLHGQFLYLLCRKKPVKAGRIDNRPRQHMRTYTAPLIQNQHTRRLAVSTLLRAALQCNRRRKTGRTGSNYQYICFNHLSTSLTIFPDYIKTRHFMLLTAATSYPLPGNFGGGSAKMSGLASMPHLSLIATFPIAPRKSAVGLTPPANSSFTLMPFA